MRYVPEVSILLAALAALAASSQAQNPYGFSIDFDVRVSAAADFDQDGVEDLLFLASEEVRVVLSDGARGLGAELVADVSGFTTGYGNAILDWNGDGYPDVVLGQSGLAPEGFLVLLNQGGAGFAAPSFVPALTTQSFDFYPVDPDGDGRDSIAVTRGGFGDNFYLVSDGGGSPVYTLVGPLSHRFAFMAASDLDGDGDEELIGVERFEPGIGAIAVRIYDSLAGSLQEVAALMLDDPPGITSAAVVPFDRDADGDLDLIVFQAATFAPASFGVIHVRNDGAGTFEVEDSYDFDHGALIAGTRGALVADWNGDGEMELAMDWGRGGSRVGVYRVPPAQPLELLFSFPVAQPLGGSNGPVSVRAFGEFDGDGNPDVLTGYSLVFGGGALQSPFLGEFLGGAPFDVASDFEGDGDLDLVAFPTFADRQVTLHENDGMGEFRAGRPLLPDLPSPLLRYEGPSAIVDVDGDGLREVLVTIALENGGAFVPALTRLFRDAGDGPFEDGGSAVAVGTVLPVAPDRFADMDLDGDLDLVGRDSVWWNLGVGSFTDGGPLVAGEVWDVGDVDQDGDEDLLASEVTGPTTFLRFRRNDGNLSFSSEPVYESVGFGDLQQVELHDLGGDGDLDAVILAHGGLFLANKRVLAVEYGSRSFGATSLLVNDLQQGPQLRFLVGRADEDPYADVLVLHDAIGSGFQPSPVRSFGGIAAGVEVESSRFRANQIRLAADVDGDGDADLLGAHLFSSAAYAPSDGGRIRQFGSGVPGTGEAVPVLGSTGPVREGESIELRVRRALGGSVALLVLGLSEDAVAGQPFPGFTLFVSDLYGVEFLGLSGAQGAAAVGSATLPLALGTGLAGQRFFAQAFVLDDGGAFGLSASGGLELEVGS